jgi:succinate-semialdehyde dehydrogenase/glutarate-semialdehyde dehydrogenase
VEATTKARKTRARQPKQLESFSPLTGELVGTVDTLTPAAVQKVVDDVASVQPAWAELRLSDRAAYMRRAADVLLESIDDLAELLTAEQGKPRTESYTMELLPTIDALHWIADNGPKILADEKISMSQAILLSKSSHFSYEPIGVVGVIAPWNYPWSIPFGEVAIALMAGNGVVLKPASLTPLLGERIRGIFEAAGFPEGLVRTVHGGGRIGDALAKSSAGKIFFTGSVEVGRKVGEVCARNLKGSVLELGGKDPMIVCSDAKLVHATAGAVWGGFANAGQTCSGIERVYVHRDIARPFIAGVVERAQQLRVGNPIEWDTEIGPMTSEDQYDTVCELVDDAIAAGAERVCGGPVEIEGAVGKFIAPTVLTGVTHEMRIMKEEIFGPVLPIITVDSDEQAVELANDSEFGLGASVWTSDRQKGERIARQIQSGMVWTNDHSFSHGACQCSWGGVKHSGLGRSHSKFGFYECTNIKLVAWEPGLARDFWWHPYDRTLGEAVRASAKLLYGRNGQRMAALREGLGPLIKVGARTMRRNGTAR